MTLPGTYPSTDANVTIAIDADTSKFTEALDQASRGSLKLGATLANALDGVVTKGKNVTSIIDTLALSLSKFALNAAFKPLDSAVSGAVNDLLSGSLPVPFASGGVISSPVAFPLGAGQTGIAGERGPEAILPLTRGPDGKLGIAGAGGGTPINVTFNVASPDAESFSRSETQIAAMLARTVAQGQRNL